MMYDVVQQSLEERIQLNWVETAIVYDNVAFNSDLYTEYLRHTVIFADGLARTVTRGCYRQIGQLSLSIFTKPATGTARQLQLATIAANMYTSVQVNPNPPLVAPIVKFAVPSMFRNNKEHLGWVMAQVIAPFYYDFTQE